MSNSQRIYYIFAGIIDNATDSLFTYSYGESWITFYDPGFVPVYKANFSDPVLEEEAIELCGADQFCLFDVAATGSMDIGLATLDGSFNFNLLVEMSAPGESKLVSAHVFTDH